MKLITAHCETFGIPEEISTDRGPSFVSKETQNFFKVWGINHRLSSANNPHSNCRAEVSVKSMKHLLRGNIGRDRSLDTIKFAQDLL